AYQWFNNLGILAYLPLSNNKISIVWSTNNYEELLLQSAADFAKNAAIASNYKLGKLKLISKPASFSLKMSLVNSLYI
ncbi:MAG TPA: hypothetical protein PKD00_08735, partial [Burkholderiales bacterium]|nr:hypothetical protein [Burkholderiales bacterium]